MVSSYIISSNPVRTSAIGSSCHSSNHGACPVCHKYTSLISPESKYMIEGVAGQARRSAMYIQNSMKLIPLTLKDEANLLNSNCLGEYEDKHVFVTKNEELESPMQYTLATPRLYQYNDNFSGCRNTFQHRHVYHPYIQKPYIHHRHCNRHVMQQYKPNSCNNHIHRLHQYGVCNHTPKHIVDALKKKGAIHQYMTSRL